MTDPSRFPASISQTEGVILCRKILTDIRETEELRNHPFGKSVYKQVRGMLTRLQEGAFFSKRMENALNSWNQVVQKDPRKANRKKKKTQLKLVEPNSDSVED